MHRHALLVTLVTLSWATTTLAATLRVPSEYPTVQAGIDASSPGDTVLVAPGTYSDYEVRTIGFTQVASVAFLKGGIVLRSETGAPSTILDLHGAAGTVGYVVCACDLVGDAEIVGFTVTGAPFDDLGIGVRDSDKLIVRECEIVDMEAGGIDARFTDLDVIGCVFRGLRRNSGSGILQQDGRLLVEDSWFEDCRSQAINMEGEPGFVPAEATIRRSVFVNNFSESGSGAATIYGCEQGMTVEDSFFLENGALGGNGGLDLGGVGAKLVRDCMFTGNYAGADGSLFFGGDPGEIVGNTFWRSSANLEPRGAAITFSAQLVGTAFLSRNVIAGSSGGPAITVLAGEVETSCNVFWSNAGGEGIPLDPTDRVIDPEFCDPVLDDVTLRPTSPCLPGNSQGCGLIGAEGVGCGTVGVSPTTWSRLKAMYFKRTGDE